MNSLKRMIWCLLLFGIQLLYFPLNHYMKGGIEFKTILDVWIPIWPVWVIPYSLVCVWWVVAYVWSAMHMNERDYEAFFIASALAQIIALVTFSFFPTYVVRPTLPEGGWTTHLLNFIYQNDYAYNAFPSGHMYITSLIALFWARWYPKWKWVWFSTVGVIFLATLFTGQHYLPDPIGGLILAWLSYRVGYWCVHEKPRQPIFQAAGETGNGGNIRRYFEVTQIAVRPPRPDAPSKSENFPTPTPQD